MFVTNYKTNGSHLFLNVASNVLHILASSCVGVLVKGIHCVRRKLLDGGL